MDYGDLDTVTSPIDIRQAWSPVPGALVIFKARAPANELTRWTGRPLTVGRAEACTLRLPDLELAREHAEIRHRDEGRWELTDRGSKNAMFLNGLRVSGATLEHPSTGDRLLIVRFGGSIALLGDWQWYDRDRFVVGEIVSSPRLTQAHGMIAAAASSGRTALIYGESGAGKEHAAEVYRRASRNSGGPFDVINCARLKPETAGVELFGAKKGAYTGATTDRVGAFERLDNGVLFLDEIATLNLEVQAELLRVVQDKVVRKLGAESGRKVNVHVVCATNEDLESAVAKGRFRHDLFMRLREAIVTLPPLRERLEEIPYLIARAADGFAVAPDFVEACLLHRWEGNVRELLGVVASAVDHARAEGARSLHAADFAAVVGTGAAAPAVLAEPPETPRARAPRHPEKFELFAREYEANGGNVVAAAKSAGVAVSTGYEWVKELGAKRGK